MAIEAQSEWVQAALSGDIDSFGRLCEWYYSAQVAVAYSVLGDHQLAEDATQEAFARALVNLRKLKDPGRFGPWLAQICRNVAIDMARVRLRQRRKDDGAVAYDGDSDEETLRTVRQGIDTLPAAMKEVVILRYYDHRSYEQIADVLDLSRTTVNGRLTRAKRKLAKYLRRQGVLESEP
ncbi:MAG: RNA polymerase sigma factor [Phycisphaerales bacterium]|nr:MAG: RNA polymerase sigma factor [Phycisphaerales bacterium]